MQRAPRARTPFQQIRPPRVLLPLRQLRARTRTRWGLRRAEPRAAPSVPLLVARRKGSRGLRGARPLGAAQGPWRGRGRRRRGGVRVAGAPRAEGVDGVGGGEGGDDGRGPVPLAWAVVGCPCAAVRVVRSRGRGAHTRGEGQRHQLGGGRVPREAHPVVVVRPTSPLFSFACSVPTEHLRVHAHARVHGERSARAGVLLAGDAVRELARGYDVLRDQDLPRCRLGLRLAHPLAIGPRVRMRMRVPVHTRFGRRRGAAAGASPAEQAGVLRVGGGRGGRGGRRCRCGRRRWGAVVGARTGAAWAHGVAPAPAGGGRGGHGPAGARVRARAPARGCAGERLGQRRHRRRGVLLALRLCVGAQARGREALDEGPQLVRRVGRVWGVRRGGGAGTRGRAPAAARAACAARGLRGPGRGLPVLAAPQHAVPRRAHVCAHRHLGVLLNRHAQRHTRGHPLARLPLCALQTRPPVPAPVRRVLFNTCARAAPPLARHLPGEGAHEAGFGLCRGRRDRRCGRCGGVRESGVSGGIRHGVGRPGSLE